MGNRHLPVRERRRTRIRASASAARRAPSAKQSRGNGGIGVSKVELRDATGAFPSLDTPVLVQSARARDETVEEMPLRQFLASLDKYFAFNDRHGRLIDQPFAPRIIEGIIRCYLVGPDA